MRGNLPGLWIKSDRGLRPVKVLRGSQTHSINRPACKFELTSGLVGGRSTVDRHDCLFFWERGGRLSHRVSFEFLVLGESPHAHVVFHHGAFLQLMPNGVRMVGVGHFEKLLKVIGRLPHLTLEVTLSGSNELLIRVIGLLVASLIAAGSDCDSLGSPLCPPLVAFDTPLCALASYLEGRPSTAVGGRLPVVLNKNGSDRLLAIGVPSGDVEQLLCCLWLIAVELMQQGSAVRAGQEH
jgi:hypothetical protein